jgi:hypothetical protein
MKKYLSIVLLLIIFGVFSEYAYSEPPFIWGIVKWSTGSPAAGLEVKLVRNGVVAARAYTNQAGRYAFFGIADQPSEYFVMVYYQDRKLTENKLPPLSIGSQAPDMTVQQ